MKKYGGTELISEKKMEVLYAKFNEKAEAATSSYSVTGDSLQNIYSVPVNIRTSEHPTKAFSSLIFPYRYFLTILIMVTEQLY